MTTGMTPGASPAGSSIPTSSPPAEDVDATGKSPAWATVLGITPPFRLERIRAAYRARSRTAHPDVGGSHADFIRLREAYEEALAFCTARVD
jgi:hypothetical protein